MRFDIPAIFGFADSVRLLDQCSNWCNFAGCIGLLGTQGLSADEASGVNMGEDKPTRSFGLCSNCSRLRLSPLCSSMGWRHISMERWPYHRIVCSCWCLRHRLHCGSNLAQERCDCTTEDLPSAQHPYGLRCINRNRRPNRSICIL